MKTQAVRRTMSPMELSMLLHFFVTPIKHENQDSPAGLATVETFIRDGLLIRHAGNEGVIGEGSGVRVTDRAKAYIERVLATPLPVAHWIFPEPELDDPRVRPFSREDCARQAGRTL